MGEVPMRNVRRDQPALDFRSFARVADLQTSSEVAQRLGLALGESLADLLPRLREVPGKPLPAGVRVNRFGNDFQWTEEAGFRLELGASIESKDRVLVSRLSDRERAAVEEILTSRFATGEFDRVTIEGNANETRVVFHLSVGAKQDLLAAALLRAHGLS
jgi:hypothetical protein